MDEHTFRVLELEKVLTMTAVHACSEPGRKAVQKIRPLENVDAIKHRIGLVSECRKIISEGRSLGLEHFVDLLPVFKKVRPDDAMLDPFEIQSFLPVLYSALNLKVLSDDPVYSRIGSIVSQLTTHGELTKSIALSIDREGKLKDNASPALYRIRQSIEKCAMKVKGVLGGILNQEHLVPHLQDFYLAERNGRWVLPVKTDSKGSVPGIVHDVSNTGETVYVEPFVIQQLGNELESFRAEEKIEEFRILRKLSSLLREHLPDIENDYYIIAEVDALNAVAVFSEQLNMSPPEINENRLMSIQGGRHPLLWKALQSGNRGDDLIPLDLEIGREHSCMIITGSNAGGKTVALKTIGVLSFMALSGMHTPSRSGTSFPFFRQVLADIGDEQSIEQNLSTFSAHVTRISKIIRKSGEETLVIIDELGTGTDPEQGGALSCALLRRLNKQGAISLVSTHLGMLKVFAHAEPGVMNGAMEMEDSTVSGVPSYRPTYKLLTGEPGTSHTFEMAESLGLPKDLINDARNYITDEDAAVESLIAEMKRKRGELNSKLSEAGQAMREVELMRSELKEELLKIDTEKKNTIAQALCKAEEILGQTKREARDIVRALRKSRPEDAGEPLKVLERKHLEIKNLKDLHSPEKKKSLENIKAGQHVFISVLNLNGTVDSVNEKSRSCKVVVGGKEFLIPFSELFEAAHHSEDTLPSSGKKDRQPAPSYTLEDVEMDQELNVIGRRVDPALSQIERYLNDAALSGLSQVKIIHGIGTGVLSGAIRDFVKSHPLVQNGRAGSEEEGGDAVTIIVL